MTTADGSGSRTLVKARSFDRQVREQVFWEPDSRSIVFWRPGGLWRADANSEQISRIVKTRFAIPLALSADETKIAYRDEGGFLVATLDGSQRWQFRSPRGGFDSVWFR